MMPEIIEINTESAHLSEEQFFRLCSDNKEIRFERDKFKNIILMAPTGSWTSGGQMGIAAQLWNWNNRTKLGQVFDSSGGFTLPNGAMRAPDASWIAKERWKKVPQDDKEKFAHICPDFIIEVRSKTDSLKLLKEKMEEWIENGCRLAWLIDLENKTAHIYKQNKETVIKKMNETLECEDVLPGFKLKLNDIL